MLPVLMHKFFLCVNAHFIFEKCIKLLFSPHAGPFVNKYYEAISLACDFVK